MQNPYKTLGSLFCHILLSVYVFDGMFEGQKLRLLVADDGTTLTYITRLVFPDGASVSRSKMISALKGPDLADIDADVVVVGANRLLKDKYTSRGFQIVPKWVQLLLPVQEDPYTRLRYFNQQSRKYFNWMFNKVKGAGFECEEVTDPSWFTRFYHEMYKPYILQRFNEDAEILEPNVVENYYKKGRLVIAKKNGEPVAGVMIYRDGDMMCMPFLGIAGNSSELVKEGVQFALHFFAAQMAHSQGCKFLNFGLSRPFLSDGTLKYKLNWHMDVVPFDDVAGVFAIATPGCTPQAQRFLETHPHFFITGEECLRSDKQSPKE